MAGEVRLARLNTLYLGLAAGVLVLATAPLLLAARCRPPPGSCHLAGAAGLAAAAMIIMLHELLHLAAAKLLRVPGARLRVEPRLVAIMLDYDYMTPMQYFAVALAPQVLTPTLLLAASLLGGLTGYAACIAGLANLAGGAPDVVNALYFTLAHRGAKRLMLLYSCDGKVEGGVVEERDGSLTIYLMRAPPREVGGGAAEGAVATG